MKIVSRIAGWVRRAPPGTRLALVASAIGIAWACTVGTTHDEYDPLRLEITSSIADNVLGPTYAEFDVVADALVEATAAWASAVASGGDGVAERMAAQESWNAAMVVWQRAELMQLGPAGVSAFHVGGAELRDEIYSWPTVSACRVDEEIVARTYEDPSFFTESLVNVKGLAAIEYVLFVDVPSNACAATDPINTGATWDALGPEEVSRRRSAFAAAAAVHVASNAQTLADAWAPGSGEFAIGLSTAGEPGSPYASPVAALDEIASAMLYVDTQLKDGKLSAASVEEVESMWAHRSKEHAVANLEAVRLLVLGGPTPEAGTGFDDFLRERGEDRLADDLLVAIDDAIAAVQAVSPTFEEALASDPAALTNAHDVVAALSTSLKTDLVLALSLSPPGEGAGDID